MQKNWIANIMQSNWPLWILAAMAVVGFMLTMLILHTSINDVVDKKEISSWKFSGHALNGKCPIKQFPICVVPQMERGPVNRALIFWNNTLTKKVFQICEEGVPIKVAPRTHSKYAEYCEPVKQGDGQGSQDWPHMIAWTEMNGTLGNWKSVIYVCYEKYIGAIHLQKTPAAKIVRNIGMEGYLRHELGHLLIGVGHPKYADLMSPGQRLTRLHAHTRALIEKTLIQPCSK